MEAKNTPPKKKYSLKYIQGLLEPMGYDYERIMYVYHFVNGRTEEAEEFLEVLESEEEKIKRQFSVDNV